MSDEATTTPTESTLPPEPVIVPTPEIAPEPTPEITPEPELNTKMESEPIAVPEVSQTPAAEPVPEIKKEEVVVEHPAPNVTVEKRGTDVTITEVMEKPKEEAPERQSKKSLKDLFSKLKEKLAWRTEKRLSKIMEMARKRGEIRNDDVEKLLRVSDRTAASYLKKLESRGQIKNVGNPKWPRYSPN